MTKKPLSPFRQSEPVRRLSEPLRVAFDCDGTLITSEEDGAATPNEKVVELLRWFQQNGDSVIVWSRGGTGYASRRACELGVEGVEILEKWSELVDIAIDDQPVEPIDARVHVWVDPLGRPTLTPHPTKTVPEVANSAVLLALLEHELEKAMEAVDESLKGFGIDLGRHE